jgi:hypothetical protein
VISGSGNHPSHTLLPVAKEGNVSDSGLDIGEVTAAQQNPLAGILHLVQPGFLNTAEIRDGIKQKSFT